MQDNGFEPIDSDWKSDMLPLTSILLILFSKTKKAFEVLIWKAFIYWRNNEFYIQIDSTPKPSLCPWR